MSTPPQKRALMGERLTLTLSEQRALAEDKPGHWSDGQRRHYDRWVKRNEETARRTQRERVERAVALRDDQMSNLASNIDEAEAEVKRITDEVQHGRLAPSDAYHSLAAVARRWEEASSLLESIQTNEEELLAVANADPADLEVERAERFPALAGGSVLTPGVLDGEDA